ncbi:MAG: ACT domain-containing protein [Oscillospiraceae bacterium]|jgi:aspartate kinase|nr:ACT domain-containing protein [Oscillospiraceae bacterium]
MNGVSKLTLTEDVSVITFNKLSAEPSNVAKILNQFSEEGINIDMISQTVPNSGEISLSLTVFSEDLMKALSLCTQLKDSVSDLRPLVSSGNCKLQLYGEEMRSMHGVAAKAIDVIASAGEEIYLITTSEVDISVLLPRDRVHEAVSALEKAFGVACQ